MNGNTEEKKSTSVKIWHIIAAVAVLVSGILIAVSGVSAGFVLIIIDVLCALHILFPAVMVERYLKKVVRSSSTIANIVRSGAIIITVFVDIFFLI